MTAEQTATPPRPARGVRNVIFDMGGVVLDWNPDAILESLYAEPSDRALIKAALFGHPDWHELDRGTLSEEQMLARLAVRLPRPVPKTDGLFDAVRRSLKPKPATLALIERLAQRRVPLYCLSNMPVGIYEHLRAEHDFWNAFEGIVISGQVRMIKPERQIFEHLIARYALVAQRTVFIDDLPQNIEAARAVGLNTVWFRDAQQCERELEALLD
jgi:putative hydrolase of the HAD superfamily